MRRAWVIAVVPLLVCAAAASARAAETSTGATPTASPSPTGIGGALGTVGGIVVLAVLAAGFLWLRGRSLRR
jgi:hypothetical protein